MKYRMLLLTTALILTACDSKPATKAPPQQQTDAVQPLVAPMTIADKVDFPRVTRLADKAAMDRINALLKDMETQERKDRAECDAAIKESGSTPEPDTYSKTLEVTWVSPRFLSMLVTYNTDCGGAYPNVSEEPRTFDLVKGERLNWDNALKPGIAEDPKALRALYRAAYLKQKDRADDEDCKGVIRDMDDDTTMIVWLDRKAGGLMIQPDLPHVVQACADPIAFGAKDVAPFVADTALLADLAKP